MYAGRELTVLCIFCNAVIERTIIVLLQLQQAMVAKIKSQRYEEALLIADQSQTLGLLRGCCCC